MKKVGAPLLIPIDGHDTHALKIIHARSQVLSPPVDCVRAGGRRPIKVVNPEQELRLLTQQLVAGKEQQPGTRKRDLRARLGAALLNANLGGLLKKNVEIHPPALPEPLKVSFAYRNGKLNLIEPVQFAGLSNHAVFSGASAEAVRGAFVADFKDSAYGPVGLVVVANFDPGQEAQRTTATEIMDRHQVPFYTFDRLDPLLDDIRENGH